MYHRTEGFLTGENCPTAEQVRSVLSRMSQTQGDEMLTIKTRSKKPCIICKKTDKTCDVNLPNGEFRGVMCMDCAYGHVPEPVAKKKENASPPSQAGRGAA